MLCRSLFVTVLFLALFGSLAMADDPGTLEVTAKDAEGRALAGVQVLAWTPETVLHGTTGADGTWSAPAPAGNYAIGVRAQSRIGSEQYNVEVKAGQKAVAEFELEAGIGFIGRVVDAADQPVVDADVLVEAGGSFEGKMEHTFGVAPWARDRTNADGRFFVGGIPDGAIATISVTAKGLQTTRMSIRAVDGKIRPDPVVVRVSVGASVSGRVTGPEGKPATGATVYLIPTDRPQLLESPTIWITGHDGTAERALTATTDDEGRYRIKGAQIDREYLVKAHHAGFALSAASERITPTLDKLSVSSDVELIRGASLSVRLLAPDGTSVTTAELKVGTSMTAPELEEANEGERFVFHGLTLGQTSIEVEAPGFLKHIQAVELKRAAPQAISVTLDPGVRIRGILRSGSGAPIAEVHVSTDFKIANPVSGWTSHENAEATTDAKGHFDLGPLRPGTYELELRSRDWELSVELMAEAPSEGVELTAHRLARVTLRFVKPDGTPFEGSLFVWRNLAGDHGTSSGDEQDTDAGRLTLTAIGPTAAKFTFEFEDYATIHRTLSSPDGKDLDLGDLRLVAGVTIRGRVLLPSGEPAAEAAVRLDKQSADTQDDGRFILEHVPAGPVVLSAKAEGLPRAFFTFEASAATKEQVLQLIEGVLVRTLLLDAAGVPVPGCRIGVDVKMGRSWHSWGGGRSRKDGRFEGRLPVGRLRFTWAKEMDEPFTTLLELDLAEGKPRDITLRVPK